MSNFLSSNFISIFVCLYTVGFFLLTFRFPIVRQSNYFVTSRVHLLLLLFFFTIYLNIKIKQDHKSLNLSFNNQYSNYHQLLKCWNRHECMFSSSLYSGGIYIKGKRKTNKSKSTNHFKKSKIFIKIYMNIPKCLCIIMFMNLFGGLIWLYLSKYVVISWELYISLNVVIENLYVLYIDGKKLDYKEHFQYDYHPSF